MCKKVQQVNINDDNFWFDLEKNDDTILKWNPEGEYDKVFTPEYKSLLDYFHNLPEIQRVEIGDIVTGKISSISKKEFVIDINYKDSIYVDIKAADFKIVQNLKKGIEIDVMVTSISESPAFEIKGSITELIKLDVANKLRDYYKERTALVAKVVELIPAGFMLDIEMQNINITAFMPNTLAGVNRLTPEQSQALVGQDVNVMLETLQQEKGVYVVSRKKFLLSLVPEMIIQLKEDKKEEMVSETPKVYTGYVTGSKDFGVFVEFNPRGEDPGRLTGMIHKVNLNEAYHKELGSIPPGTEVDFYCRDILKGDRIILTQILRESLWDTIRVGQVKDGTVRTVKPFGALIALDDETTGLVQNTYIERAGVSLKKGDKVKVKVVSVIKDDRKIYLDFPKK